jgi:AraC-like DNA-binding protein
MIIKNNSDNNGIYEYEYQLLFKFKEIEHSRNISKDELSGKFSALVKEYERLLQKAAKIFFAGDVNLREMVSDNNLAEEPDCRGIETIPSNFSDLCNQTWETFQKHLALHLIGSSDSKINVEFIKELEDVIEKNMADPEFNVAELSRKLHMNRVTLYRKVQGLIGETPTEFIRSYRLKRGFELLWNNFGTILDIALEVGFSSATYFTKCFKKKFKHLPSNVKWLKDEKVNLLSSPKKAHL